jgi:hypothetical protein
MGSAGTDAGACYHRKCQVPNSNRERPVVLVVLATGDRVDVHSRDDEVGPFSFPTGALRSIAIQDIVTENKSARRHDCTTSTYLARFIGNTRTLPGSDPIRKAKRIEDPQINSLEIHASHLRGNIPSLLPQPIESAPAHRHQHVTFDPAIDLPIKERILQRCDNGPAQ